jgi:uncharacterized protein
MQFTFELVMLLGLTFTALMGWSMNVLGMPGNWLIVSLALGNFFLADPANSLHLGIYALVAILAFAGLGELLEFAAGAMGANRLGASKRASALAIVGSMVGAIIGLFAGSIIPIPVVGSIIGSILLGGAGAAVGAVSGERWAGKDWDVSMQVGHAAFWGRLFGTLGKAVCGTAVCIIYLMAIWKS